MGESKKAAITSFVLFALAISLLFASPMQAADIILPKDTLVHVYFSPNGGCTHAIVDTIDKAESEVLVQAYIFTSESIAKALLVARKRGVKVLVILDKSEKKDGYSPATFFAKQEFPACIDSMYVRAHDKIMIIDKETIVTRSFIFSRSAENQN